MVRVVREQWYKNGESVVEGTAPGTFRTKERVIPPVLFLKVTILVATKVLYD